MRTLVPFLVVLLLSLICAGTHLAAEEASCPIPVISGGRVQFEMNLTDRDFLPALQELLDLLATTLRAFGQASSQGASADPAMAALAQVCSEDSMKELRQAISGLKQLSVVTYSAPGATPESVANFYMQKLGLSKGWQRTLRMDDPRGSVRVYTMPNLEGIFGYVVSSGNVAAFRTAGRIDLPAIMKWIGQVLPLVMQTAVPSAPGPTSEEHSQPQERAVPVAPAPPAQ